MIELSLYQKMLLSQSHLISCVIGRTLLGEDSDNGAKSAIFMGTRTPEEQWILCKKRIENTRLHIIDIMTKENWPCNFPEGNQMFFNKYKPSFGSNRIAIGIGPDTYSYIYMETCLLRIGTRQFLDQYGYTKQNTKEWKCIDDLVDELRQLVNIYNDTNDFYNNDSDNAHSNKKTNIELA